VSGGQPAVTDDEQAGADDPAQVSGAFLTVDCGPTASAAEVPPGREPAGCAVIDATTKNKYQAADVTLDAVDLAYGDGTREALELTPAPAESPWHVLSHVPINGWSRIASLTSRFFAGAAYQVVNQAPGQYHPKAAPENLDPAPADAARPEILDPATPSAPAGNPPESAATPPQAPSPSPSPAMPPHAPSPAPATPPASDPSPTTDTRALWEHASGSFKQESGSNWTEERTGDTPIAWRENARTVDYVELYDMNRDMNMRLHATYSEWNQHGGPWTRWVSGAWTP
jgi:hypothetical protein